MIEFMLQDLMFLGGQTLDSGELLRGLSEDGTQLEGADIGLVAHLVVDGKCDALPPQLLMAEPGQRIGEFGIQIASGTLRGRPKGGLRHEWLLFLGSMLGVLSELVCDRFAENTQVIFHGHLDGSDLASQALVCHTRLWTMTLMSGESTAIERARLQEEEENRGGCCY